MATKMVTIECRIVHETDKALLITCDEKDECWLPKSKIKVQDSYPLDQDALHPILVPEWLAFNNCLL